MHKIEAFWTKFDPIICFKWPQIFFKNLILHPIHIRHDTDSMKLVLIFSDTCKGQRSGKRLPIFRFGSIQYYLSTLDTFPFSLTKILKSCQRVIFWPKGLIFGYVALQARGNDMLKDRSAELSGKTIWSYWPKEWGECLTYSLKHHLCFLVWLEIFFFPDRYALQCSNMLFPHPNRALCPSLGLLGP